LIQINHSASRRFYHAVKANGYGKRGKAADAATTERVNGMATNIGEVCSREVVFTTRNTTVAAAAKLMRHHHVGSLVVVEQLNGGKRLPIGIVTDRDIVMELTAMGLDPDAITVGDIMSEQLVTASEGEGLLGAMEIMRYKGVRRLPVVGGDGQLVGIVTIDDLLEVLAEQLTELAKVVGREQSREAAARK
jgi:CBS domain-containing protein